MANEKTPNPWEIQKDISEYLKKSIATTKEQVAIAALLDYGKAAPVNSLKELDRIAVGATIVYNNKLYKNLGNGKLEEL